MSSYNSETGPNVVVINGGTGVSTLLHGIKEVASHTTGIFSMSDSGGCTGITSEEFDIPPVGDLRQGLLALSTNTMLAGELAERHQEGELEGRSKGNLWLAELITQKHAGLLLPALEDASRQLGLHNSSVLPVTTDRHSLLLRDGDTVVEGENLIDKMPIAKPMEATVELTPQANVSQPAVEAIERADLVVMAPSSLFTSSLPALAVTGMREAINASRARLVVVSNLFNEKKQTAGLHAVDYVQKFGLRDHPNDVIVYNNRPPRPELLRQNAQRDEELVDVSPERFKEVTARDIGANLIDTTVRRQPKADRLPRTLIRHDARAVAALLLQLAPEPSVQVAFS